MNNEVLPYRWRLWIKDTQIVVDDDDYCSDHYGDSKTSTKEKTILKESSMKCHFAVYNGKNNQDGDPIMRFVEDCFNDNFEDYDIYRYFDEYHKTKSD
jgi:hypothetical protein